MTQKEKRCKPENDCEGMTDCQYKGMLLDQLSAWKQILKLAVDGNNLEIRERVEEEIAIIHQKLKY